MKNHDISSKIKNMLHKIGDAAKSTGTQIMAIVGNILVELQCLANDKNPVHVAKILNLFVQLQKRVDDKVCEESEKS